MKKSIANEGFPYNGRLARWWHKRASDSAHARAYIKIADFIRNSYVQEPKLIVDYACGAGNLLFLLSRRFPGSKLVGLDGSSFLLGLALHQLKKLPTDCVQRISLIETPLPNMSLLRGKADLAIFCFPNMVSSSGQELLLSENDRKIARRLSLDEVDEIDSDRADAPAIQSGLEQSRVISLNLRRLMAPGGICIRVEYATIQRHELSDRALMLVSFEEGSLDSSVEGMTPKLWFRVLASSYCRSRVLEDVYEQTADERDRNGGYLITVLRAI
jgi:SAM-dependent methyltransferase